MHAFVFAGKTQQPGFLHCEAQDGREPDYHAAENFVRNGAHRAAAQAGRRIAIQCVFANVEIQRRQFIGAKAEHGGEHFVEIELGIGRTHNAIQLRQFGQHIAFQLWHVGGRDAFGLVKAVKIGQHETDRVAQAAIGIDIRLDDVLTDAQIFGEVRTCRPQAQNIGAILFGNDLRCQRIAQRFGHFVALVIQHKTMRQHRLVGRVPRGATAFKQR